MANNRSLVVCLMLLLAASAAQAATGGRAHSATLNRRSLLQSEDETADIPTARSSTEDEAAEEEPEDEEEEPKELTPEEREAERERAALEAFAERQEEKAAEQEAMIEEALITAEASVEAYRLAGKSSERIAVFVELFENADGLAAKFALNTLADRGIKGGRFVRNNVQQAIGRAINAGFSDNVARAISYAFTVRRTPRDHIHLLDALETRRTKLNRRRRNSGCTFIKNLFTDADLFANERGDSMAFVAAFEAQEYLPLMECYLDECEGEAAECCGDETAIQRGLCGCPRRNSNRCDFNLFANNPRTIWICSRRGCVANQKCLCPAS